MEGSAAGIQSMANELKLVEVAKDSMGMELIIVADRGFDSDPLRRESGALGRTSSSYYRMRFQIENLSYRLKRWSSISTRRDKLALNYLAWVQFAPLLDCEVTRKN